MKGAILWKRILNEGLLLWPRRGINDEVGQALIIRSPIIVAPPTEAVESHWTDVSGIAPPFEKFWIEGSAGVQRWGCLCRVATIDAGFRLSALTVQSWPGSGPQKLGDIEIDLDKQGTLIPNTFVCAVPDDIATGQFSRDEIKGGIAGPALGACLALMLLGCKNVSLMKHENDPKQVRRAIKRHGGTPESYRYHTLVVRAAGARGDSPAHEIGLMPSHVCRGHFAEYGPEFGKGLLFGKYAGRFYVPPVMKGNKQHGVVEKDYEIGAPPAVEQTT